MTVVVVGSVNTDLVARVPHVPRPGETLLGSDLARHGGGKGANQAVAAARAGAVPVAFVGAVGSDPDGEALRGALVADGIDTAGLVTVPGPSGMALITVAQDGENAIVVAPGANGALSTLTDVQRRVVAAADVVVAQLEVPVPLVLDAARTRSDHALLVLNAAPSAPLTDPGTAADLLAVTDVLVLNEHELADVGGPSPAGSAGTAGTAGTAGKAGTDTPEAIARVADRVPALIVTLGSDGAVIAVGDDRRRVPAFPARAVDTTGAGDTFCGVLAAALAGAGGGSGERRVPPIDALAQAARAASAAAALAVGRVGAQASVPTAAEVRDLLAGAPKEHA
ncbi:ribokinase [Occultella glacieicola]|uniref:Ribokinase n=1 Tax=Occultella glacieicola TaxID=2518684 RepID=A0ABY2E9E4_9MICO|nr:PfkB family carbohydrate kinase [Occultella glacieicola]TDE99125.1 ribokinase [Occultella glacieicola]